MNWVPKLQKYNLATIDSNDRDRLAGEASSWFTCACGENLQIPPQEVSSGTLGDAIHKVDPVAYQLGAKFSRMVVEGKQGQAIALAKSIDSRLSPKKIEKIRKEYVRQQHELRRDIMSITPYEERKLPGWINWVDSP